MASFNYPYLRHLEFFDRAGKPLNLEFSADINAWYGEVYFPRVSVDLYENQHIFIVENVLDGMVSTYSFPLLNGGGTTTWRARWETGDDAEQIFTYLIEEENNVPFITAYQQVDVDNPAVAYTTGTDDIKIPATVNSAAMQFNVALTSPDEDIYERTLLIEDLSTSPAMLVAKIKFYGETVGEDERLRLVLENFGRQFTQRDALMLRDYDIKEALPDYQQINEKRKEMFIAGEEIFPYMGSYRGLINVIRFFGYQDLRIKEYWLNIDERSENFGKVLQDQIDDLLDEGNVPLLKHPLVSTKVYRKTSSMGLFYDITRESGDVDQFGVPITENASMFTNEEVLLKLFALKRRLKKDYLPTNTRIVDIVGEGVYFARYGTRSWTDELTVVTQKLGVDVDFEASPTLGYVRDLRRFVPLRFANFGNLPFPMDGFDTLAAPYSSSQQYPSTVIPNLIEAIDAYYDETSSFTFPNLDERSNIGSEPGIPAGCPVVLRGRVSQFTWDDLDIAWDDPDVNIYTWDTVDFSTFYEMEWTIEKAAPSPYYFTYRGKIADIYALPHFLPFAGSYKVTMRLYDLFNNTSVEVKAGYVEVLSSELQIAAFARWRNFSDYTWDGTNDTWDDLAGSTWQRPWEGTRISTSPLPSDTFTWSTYVDQDNAEVLSPESGEYGPLNAVMAEDNSKDNPARRFGTQSLTWENMDLPWDELYHSTWESMDYHGEFLGGFKITVLPTPGDTMRINDYTPHVFVGPFVGPTAWADLAAELTASVDDGISKFDYHEDDAVGGFIYATAKHGGADGWCFVTYTGVSIVGDPYTWTYPSWLLGQTQIQDYLAYLTSINPTIDQNLFFLDTPMEDTLNGVTGTLSYWEAKGFIKTETDGTRRGHLPSWAGSGAYNTNDLRTFTNDFECPLGVPIFFTYSHSEVPGTAGARWVITNAVTGEVVIDVKHPYLCYNFIEESTYTIECWITDSNGNEAYGKRPGFVRASSKENFGSVAA